MPKDQGYDSRLDESLGMRNGKESGMSQSYKDRRDESKGMSKEMKGVMGHDSSPQKIKVPMGNDSKGRGYPAKAFDYKY